VLRLGRFLTTAVTTAGLASSWSFEATAQVAEGAPVARYVVTVNKSKTLRFDCRFSTAVIGSPDIADLLPMTDHTIYVQGKKAGTTNISVFDADKRLCSVVDLEVALDTGSLHSKIAASTGAGNINVGSANGEVVLSGQASDAVAAARAVDVAKGLATDAAGKEVNVINAMQVAPSQQVMLKVRFLEVDRTAGRDFGINLFGINKNGLGVTGLGQVSQSAGAGASTATVTTSTGSTTLSSAAQSLGVVKDSGSGQTNLVPLLGGLFPGSAAAAFPFGALLAQVINTHGLQVDALISALEDKGLVKTLAEPDLISQSGEKASFFAGSQIPIPTVQPGTIGTTPTVTVTYYPCGVTLNFVPTVLSTGLINMHLGPQVCQVSSTNEVNVNGTTIPELNTRSADTTVELRDGQSFAVAGLLQAQDVNELAQLPWIGNVPVLGALFRSTNYQKQETDLVVIVTAHLVKPVAAGKHLATPFDNSLPANDVDLFLMSDTERQKKYTEFVTSGGGVQGPYGYILETK
jgi:pilus assembly protein CpaC